MAELAGHRKRLRIARITLTKHVTTMEAALLRSDTTETELDALVQSYHTKAGVVTEEQDNVMLLTEEEDL